MDENVAYSKNTGVTIYMREQDQYFDDHHYEEIVNAASSWSRK